MDGGAWWAAVHGVTKSWTRLRDFTFTFHFHALEKEMATHSSVLAWRIPGMGEPGGLPSMGSHRVGHDWSDLVVVVVDFTCLVKVYIFWSYHHKILSVLWRIGGWMKQKVVQSSGGSMGLSRRLFLLLFVPQIIFPTCLKGFKPWLWHKVALNIISMFKRRENVI